MDEVTRLKALRTTNTVTKTVILAALRLGLLAAIHIWQVKQRYSSVEVLVSFLTGWHRPHTWTSSSSFFLTRIPALVVQPLYKHAARRQETAVRSLRASQGHRLPPH